MKALNGYPAIVTDGDRREKTPHGDSAYPFAYYYENIWEFDLHCVDWHWHPELEFLYVKSGSLLALIGSERIHLKEGEGMFVNSRVLHRFEAEEPMELPNIVFSAELLAAKESLLYSKYIRPLLDSAIPFQSLRESVGWQRQILEELNAVFDLQEKKEDCEWETVQHLMGIWKELYENMPRNREKGYERKRVGRQAQLQMMLQYIQKKSREPITLDDVAASGMMSKSSAQKLFANDLHISPIEYLIHYRLQQAARLLTGTEKTVTEIAQESGFRDPAYFCRRFRMLYQMTPGQYREENAERQEIILHD